MAVNRQNGQMRAAFWLTTSILIVIGIGVGAEAFAGDGGAGTSSGLPAHLYGSPGSQFTVSFGASPDVRAVDAPTSPNRYFENMRASWSLYVATLGSDTFEAVSVLSYPHTLTAGNVQWYVHDYLFGFHPASWHGVPGAVMDVACHVGDSGQACPGRIAYRDIIVGGVIYELQATQVSENEVHRFFSSFQLAAHRD